MLAASKFDLKTILSDPPKLHECSGRLISDWKIDDTTSLELSSRLRPGIKTLETGAGLSTIIFAASGCRHTCIMPDKALADRIQGYCRSMNIDSRNVNFIISKSTDIIHQLSRSDYDLILIDGCHGFPSIFVDFYYAARALKIGGALIVDDLDIYTCLLAARFMQSDPGWNVELMTKRVAIGIKILDTVDYEWTSQRFVVERSRATSLLAPTFLKMRNFLTFKVWFPVWHFCLDATRPIRARLGLRAGVFRQSRQKD